MSTTKKRNPFNRFVRHLPILLKSAKDKARLKKRERQSKLNLPAS